jgi:hypothetical protein
MVSFLSLDAFLLTKSDNCILPDVDPNIYAFSHCDNRSSPHMHVYSSKHFSQILFIYSMLVNGLEVWCSSFQEQSPIHIFISFTFPKISIKALNLITKIDLLKPYSPLLEFDINRWIYYWSTTNPASTYIIIVKNLIDLNSLTQV